MASTSAPPPHKVELLDGGTGEELWRNGIPDDRSIWSAVAVVKPEHHETLKKVHRSFIRAGSRYITVNNYAITPGVKFSFEDAMKYTGLAGQLAVQARDEEGIPGVRVCGSLPPLLESYRADRLLPHEESVRWYSGIVRTLEPYADVYLAETLSAAVEMMYVVDALAAVGTDKPLFGSWTLQADGRLRSGETASDAILQVLEHARTRSSVKVAAFLFNCSEPEAISKALAQLAEADCPARHALAAAGVRLGAYANRLTPVAPDWEFGAAPQGMRTDLGEDKYAATAAHWVQLGASLLGGCCGIGPEYIAAMKEQLKIE